MLQDQKVILRGLEFEELMTLHDWMNDFELLQEILRIEPSIHYFTQKWYENLHTDQSKLLFAIEEKETNHFIGCIGLNHIERIDRKAELYIYIGEQKFRGKGLGQAALRVFLDYLFNFLNLHKVYLHVRGDNLAAINLYRKIGFQEEGVLREEKYMGGRYIDIIRMSIIRSESHA